MMRLTILQSYTFLLLFAAATNANGQSIDLSTKEKVLTKISSTIEGQAYVSNISFQGIQDSINKRKARFQEIDRVDDFVVEVNEMLSRYQVSHLSLWGPEYVNERKTTSSLGIGARMSQVQSGYFVNKVVRNSPAARAGIQPGDLITAVNGQQLISSAPLYGEAEDSISLTVRRDGSNRTFGLQFFKHRPYARDTLFWWQNQIPVIEINSFRGNLYDRELVEKLFSKILNQDTLILDIRGNGGGSSEHVRHLLSMVLPQKSICQYVVHREEYHSFLKQKRREPQTLQELAVHGNNILDPMKQKKKWKPFQGTLMILVDERSGSAADVFPACIQDLNRGRIIGNRTAGKTLIGDIMDLPGGMQLLFPIGESVRLNGARLEGNGVEPDIKFSRQETAQLSVMLSKVREE